MKEVRIRCIRCGARWTLTEDLKEYLRRIRWKGDVHILAYLSKVVHCCPKPWIFYDYTNASDKTYLFDGRIIETPEPKVLRLKDILITEL